jgi:hypothetical protein
MKNGENPSMKNCKKRRKHETKVRNNKIFKRKKRKAGVPYKFFNLFFSNQTAESKGGGSG